MKTILIMLSLFLTACGSVDLEREEPEKDMARICESYRVSNAPQGQRAFTEQETMDAFRCALWMIHQG